MRTRNKVGIFLTATFLFLFACAGELTEPAPCDILWMAIDSQTVYTSEGDTIQRVLWICVRNKPEVNQMVDTGGGFYLY
jgi:hypothetical protein